MPDFEAEVEMDSAFLSKEQKNQLMDWLRQSSKSSATLLYRGSTHGYQASQFHSLCDNKGATLTVVQTTSGHVIGGYNSQSWDSSSGSTTVSDSWLFTLTHNGARDVQSKTQLSLSHL